MATSPRFFVMLSGKTAEDLLDRAERHGEVIGAALYSAPAPWEAVYGPVEVDPGELRREKAVDRG